MNPLDPDTCARYDRVAPMVVEGYQAMHEAVAWELASRLPTRAQVLAVGCGTGQEVRRLAALRPDWAFFAQDESCHMLEVAARLAEAAGVASRVEFFRGGLSDVETGGFDGATCLLVGHFLPDRVARQALYAEMTNRVVVGGTVVVAEWVAGGDDRVWREGARDRGIEERHHDRILGDLAAQTWRLPESEVVALLGESGLREVTRVFQSHSTVAWSAVRA